MQFLKNKHLIMAMFTAPALAVIAYFAVDHVVSETPHAAVQGSSYKLAAKSNCRYKSGICTLENGDVKVNLHAETTADNRLELSLISVMPLQSVIVSLADDIDSTEAMAMIATTEQPVVWSASIDMMPTEKSVLRLALSISDTLYYAETTTVFIDYETSFPRENFSN